MIIEQDLSLILFAFYVPKRQSIFLNIFCSIVSGNNNKFTRQDMFTTMDYTPLTPESNEFAIFQRYIYIYIYI